MTVKGFITLDDEDIGTFEIFAGGSVHIVLTKASMSFADVVEFASENGMTIALALRPDFEDYLPNHRKELASPK